LGEEDTFFKERGGDGQNRKIFLTREGDHPTPSTKFAVGLQLSKKMRLQREKCMIFSERNLFKTKRKVREQLRKSLTPVFTIFF
jgi:hypothetical protein